MYKNRAMVFYEGQRRFGLILSNLRYDNMFPFGGHSVFNSQSQKYHIDKNRCKISGPTTSQILFSMVTIKALKYFCINQEAKGFFSF